ncbi:MAG: riboflavin synthase [Actinomycetota bacterium]|jgi:riboflavin synthase|nr:riboflavin synthase [Actinomycetota bacterium]
MFTGLVEEAGRVEKIEEGGMLRLEISAPMVSSDVSLGDSVSVNGVCLTVSEARGDRLSFDAMAETLRRTALGGLEVGSFVNLERAMSAEKRFGGHLVQGHVDGVGEVLGVVPEGGAEMWEFAASEAVLRYTVEKGSICVDGISLTVVAVRDDSFTVSILPHTRGATNLKSLRVGDFVNLEADVIGKYVEKLVGPHIGNFLLKDKAYDEFERRKHGAVQSHRGDFGGREGREDGHRVRR